MLTAGVLLSLAGITLRHIESASGWQILFYRSLTFFVVVTLYLVIRYRARVVHAFVTTGVPGLVVALSLGLGSACYVFALLLTTVANALFIISAAPFITAVSRVDRAARARAADDLDRDDDRTRRNCPHVRQRDSERAAARQHRRARSPVSFAIMLVMLRLAGDRDMIPAICLAGLVGAALGFAMSDTLVLSRHDLALCLFLGVAQYTGGFVLLTLGVRFLPAAEVALLSLRKPCSRPSGCGLASGKSPPLLTLAGGAVVLSAVVAQAVTGMRSQDGG